MAICHSVRCCYDECDWYSSQASFTASSKEEAATEHRASLVGEGWTDLEGRLYCPEHGVTA